VLNVSEIHISNRAEIDRYDAGDRVKREEFNQANEEGFYACDGKIVVFKDDM
jgi:hypothetical protein